MKFEIKVPKVSTDTPKGVLVHWYKENMEEVEKGEEIVEVMIKKITVTIDSPASGKLLVMVKENEEILQGQVIGIIKT